MIGPSLIGTKVLITNGSFNYQHDMTQGTFLVHGGSVFSLDKIYPQGDAWLPVKAEGVPLSQFIAEVQPA